MFEQATLNGGPLSTRLWSTCAGISGQAILVGVTLLVPLVWPAALPQLKSYVNLVAPGPPPPPPPPPNMTVRPKGAVRNIPFQATHGISVPLAIPKYIARIVEDPPDLPGGDGVPGGVIGGLPGGVRDSIVSSVMERAYVPPPAPLPVRVTPQAPPAPPAPPIRVPVGGQVQLGAPINRIEPVYPRMAASMRVEGVVLVEAVVGIDGRVRELRARSGHPFLIPAALDAVRQWIYTPTLLNGKPVEVIAPITVTFRLGNR
jgi:protein TonB